MKRDGVSKDLSKEYKLVRENMNKCPFIEFHAIEEIDQEIAVIRVAFDTESGE